MEHHETCSSYHGINDLLTTTMDEPPQVKVRMGTDRTWERPGGPPHTGHPPPPQWDEPTPYAQPPTKGTYVEHPETCSSYHNTVTYSPTSSEETSSGEDHTGKGAHVEHPETYSYSTKDLLLNQE